MQMDASLLMHIHHHGAKTGRLTDVALRLLNHIVHVEGLLAGLGHSLKDRKTKGDVRDERAVHHVEMQPVGLAAINHFYVTVEMQEVGRQKRR